MRDGLVLPSGQQGFGAGTGNSLGTPVAVQFTCGAGSSVEPNEGYIVGNGEGNTVVAIASATHQQALLVDAQTDMPQNAVDQSTRSSDAACLGHQ